MTHPKSGDHGMLAYSAAAIAALAGVGTAEAVPIFYEGPWTGWGRDNTLITFNLAGDVLTNGQWVSDAQFHFSNRFIEGGIGGKDLYDMLRIDNDRPQAAVLAYPWKTWRAGSTYRQTFALPLAANDVAGPAGPWYQAGEFLGTDHSIFYRQYWQEGKRAYIGLRFDGPGNDLYYGWADVTTVDKQTLTLWGYAYEPSGEPIRVGDKGLQPPGVPEPSTLSLLAMGAAGLAAVRVRRSKRETQAAGDAATAPA